MQNKAGWKLKLAKIKGDTAREVRQDYLDGFTIPELMEMYGITKRTLYKWLTVSESDKAAHLTQVMAQKKMGRPIVKGRKKKATKITDVANTNY